ncbi:MATE family efflux transporter [Hymenobacter gummosus]|uniref:Multidrug-efflux transporter n=1 Tax=Hymenobacter gummosus TaxID=1776032 RepID=A0A431TZ57_9BACT|nr:MATE family efflux transporter [Hymenobacter gummosus]RTQ47730.1 MATE family efflux transporter [Hymenobacter gummosus]
MALADLRPHFRPTLILAGPVVLSQLGHVLVNVVDSVVVGHTGTVPLAAVSLSVSTVTVLLVLGLGISMGITPLVAAADGQRDVPRIGQLLAGGVLQCAAAGVLLAALGWLLTPLLPFLGQPPAVVALAAPWIRVMLLSLIPLMVFQGFRQFAEGLGLTFQAMLLSVLANVVNGVLCYALVFGKLGAPALGMMGAAWATLAARTLMAGLMAAYVLRARRLQPYRAHLSWRPDVAIQRQLLALSLPIGAQMMFEVGAFSVSAIMTGWLGASTQAAHQIAINVASVTYMAASGIATAATIRVGKHRGQADAPGARRAGFAAYILTFAFMGSMGLLLVAGRHLIPHFYSADAPVLAQAATLLLIAALFQVSDGLQVVGLGALRGLEDVKVPSIVALLSYWALALPLSYLLGFVLNWGAPGVWLGLLAGLSAVALVLLLRFQRETSGVSVPGPEMNETAASRR